MRKRLLMVLVVGALILGATALVAGGPSGKTTATPVQAETVLVDKFQLFQSSGEQLYAELCASCHGAQGAGGGPAARTQAVYPPPLNTLEKAGVPKEHWTYVILAPCEDGHHWGPHGEETMPCWRRVFRQAMGEKDAGPMLVSVKLKSYLSDIQK